ncbi:MAG: Unknown protein [uncultured Sulfurovum sp.]|uniref:Polysaccharide biosynthesis protein n=1 Tax=uncultured Sulfurovum sp. TaxID=269237 RepID=A0A6S6SFJ9_9BACT|nr:MAG: Unknown protein [uncultured Sulfurovum sp.]
MIFLQNLKNKIFLRDGHFILLAQLVEKVINFVIMIIAARYMNVAVYGNFSYVKSIIATLTPFSGFGGNHALLRFGMDTNELKEKYILLYSSLFFGSIFTIILIFIVYFLFDISSEVEDIFSIYIFFILFYYLFLTIQNFYRIIKDNRSYALHSIKYSFSILIFGTLSLVFFNEIIFVITITLLPLFYIIISNFFQLKEKTKIQIKFNKEYWKYGLIIGIGAFLNQFFLQADILVLGYLKIEPVLIAQYKVSTLVIYLFLFIPNSFLVRDFTLISENAKNSTFLISYAFSYMQYTSLALFIILPIFYFLSNSLLSLLFGIDYVNEENIQNILIFSIVGFVLFRMPFGNILNAVGYAKFNVYNAIITIVLALFFLILGTKKYGIEGTAYAMVLVTSISGILSLAMFWYYIFLLKKNNK